MGAALLNIQRVGARGVMRGGWRLVRAPYIWQVFDRNCNTPYTLTLVPRVCLLSAAWVPSISHCVYRCPVSALPNSLGPKVHLLPQSDRTPLYSKTCGRQGTRAAQLSAAVELKEVPQIPHLLVLHRTRSSSVMP